jgi:hypothetical protein
MTLNWVKFANHSEGGFIMPDFEDAILPDDFQADTPTEEVAEAIETNEPVEAVEETIPTEQTEQTESIPQTLRVKYNHGEQDIPFDEAIPLVQKGMNFDKAVERAKQEARDTYIAEQGYEWNGQTIATEEQYKQAIFEKQLIEQYQDRDLPDDVVQELIESRKFREESKKEKEETTKKQQEDTQYLEFFDLFRQINGREFNTAQDQIPQNVWDEFTQGTPLKYAYMQHHNQELQSQLKTIKQNESNKQKSPVGSVTAHGAQETASDDPFMLGFNSI